MRLGKLIKEAREKRGHSQNFLASLLGITDSHLSLIENGKRLPGPECRTRLVKYLQISEEDFDRPYYDDKREAAIKKSAAEKRSLSFEEIDLLAYKDRASFLKGAHRNYLEFPADRLKIPPSLFQLKVIDQEVLFGAKSNLIYGGLFVGDNSYLGEKNSIVIATGNVRRQDKGGVSEETKVFHTMHEVGHFRIHWLRQTNGQDEFQDQQSPAYCSSGDRSPREQEANRYASAFLMPEEEVRNLIAGKTSFNMTKDGKPICQYFFVEPWTLGNRLQSMGVRVYY